MWTGRKACQKTLISTRELKIQAKAFFGDHVDRINFATVGKIINQFTLETKNIIRRLQYQIAKEQGGSNSHRSYVEPPASFHQLDSCKIEGGTLKSKGLKKVHKTGVN